MGIEHDWSEADPGPEDKPVCPDCGNENPRWLGVHRWLGHQWECECGTVFVEEVEND